MDGEYESAIMEIESPTGVAQNIDDEAMWFTFYNPNIGNGSGITSDTPYATIEGGGNGTWDTYEFEITAGMLDSAGSIYGVHTIDPHCPAPLPKGTSGPQL